MEFKADALLLRSVDYGEADKMVTLLTAERGKISAGMKGVRKSGAKLRFAAQPFCFAEYVFAEKSGRYTVIQAALHDGFYPLRERVESYYAAASVTEAAGALALEGMECGSLLVAAVEALKSLGEGDPSGDVRPPLVRFLLRACKIAGYPVTAGACPVCGAPISGRCRFDLDAGVFLCGKEEAGVPASEETYRAIRTAHGEAEGSALRALRLLRAYLIRKTEFEYPVLGETIALFA